LYRKFLLSPPDISIIRGIQPLRASYPLLF
jgi:hypothetical protein